MMSQLQAAFGKVRTRSLIEFDIVIISAVQSAHYNTAEFKCNMEMKVQNNNQVILHPTVIYLFFPCFTHEIFQFPAYLFSHNI